MFLIISSNVVSAACDDGTDVCLEQQSTVERVERPLANEVSTGESDSSLATKDLVDSITFDLKARRLTKPIGNNALQKVRLLSRIDPTHDYAINGTRYIARIYLSMARDDLKNKRVERARARLEAASNTDPSLPGLQAVARQLNTAAPTTGKRVINPGTIAGTNTGENVDTGSDSNTENDAALQSAVKAKPDRAEPARQADAVNGDSKSVVAGDEKSPAGDKQLAGTLITPVMVGLPAGTFVMGSESGASNEKPAHQVQIGAFSMSRYEITREQYIAFKVDTASEIAEPALNKVLLPVSGVTSNEAIAYARWLSSKTGKRFRLPTEAEWEYAARAGTMTPYHSGDTIFGVANCLTCLDDIPRSPTPVGTFEPNNFGLYDMHGNVAEWTSSCLTDSHFKNDERAEQLCTRRVVRGGSWRSTRDQVRSSFRLGQVSSGRAMDTGIRVVHDGL